MDVLNFRVFFKERIFLNKNTKITTDLRLDSQSEKHKPIKYLALLPYPMSLGTLLTSLKPNTKNYYTQCSRKRQGNSLNPYAIR